VPKLRISEDTPPLPHVLSLHAQGELNFTNDYQQHINFQTVCHRRNIITVVNKKNNSKHYIITIKLTHYNSIHSAVTRWFKYDWDKL
jgi:hypothetical protein